MTHKTKLAQTMTPPDISLRPLFRQLAQQMEQLLKSGIATPAQNFFSPADVFKALAGGMDPQRWAELQASYCENHLRLLGQSMQQPGAAATAQRAPAAVPDKNDRRFDAPEWQLPYFDYLKQAYLVNSRWLTQLIDSAQVDARTRRKLRFWMRQAVDAAAPANFAATNPEVLKLALSTNGESLKRGMEQLAADLRKGRISMTDETAFAVGRDLATTAGAVVYENRLVQLIQYAPGTARVFRRPLVIVPPCINKYYILDLQPHNSFVRYAVEQGHTVFMISWRNAGEDIGDATWDDYLRDGVVRPLEVAREICGVTQVNALGFCIGGTLLACALAVLKAKRRQLAASATYLTTMLDFTDAGDIAVFVDEEFVRQCESKYKSGGLLRGAQLLATFSSLRANELIWHYVVNNYLKGQAPAAFDLLFWNSDSTNLPGRMFSYYLRNTYLENKLRVPRKLGMCGVKIDLSQIKQPAFILASRDDHIVPWKTAYESTRLIGGASEFVLAASGHIAGVINPPQQNRRHYWANPQPAAGPDAWLGSAQQYPGSWWPRWSAWLAPHGGERVPARKKLGNAKFRTLEAAPGRYVVEKSR